MAKWRRSSDEAPAVLVGNRIVVVVVERPTLDSPLASRLVILEAMEEGWASPDPVYSGYSYDLGEAWTTERELLNDALIATQEG